MELPSWMNPWAPGGVYDKAVGNSEVGKAINEGAGSVWTGLAQPAQAALNRMGALGVDPSLRDYAMWQQLNKSGMTAPERGNPYSPIIADQTRAAQTALMQQMQNRMQNQSVAGQMGAQAMGQNAMAASAAMGGGPLASRMAAGRMGTVGGGLMGQAAMGRMQENLGGLGGMFGVATGMRGQSLRSAADQAQAGLGMRGLEDQNRQFYAGAGAGLEEAQNRAKLAYYQMLMQLKQQGERGQQEAVGGAARGAATFLGGIL